MFGVMQEATEETEGRFSEQYNYLKQMPRGWFLKTFLGRQYPRVFKMDEPDFMKAIFKKDEKVHEKLIEFSLGLPLDHPFGPRPHAEWLDIYLPRLARQGHVVQHLAITTDGEIDWGTSGCYKLVPEVPPGEEGSAEHKFHAIRLQNLVVPLGAYANVITAEHYLNFNWSAEKAVIVDPDGRNPILCKDLFAKEPAWTEFVRPVFEFVKEPKKRKGEKKDEDEKGRKEPKRYYLVGTEPPSPAAREEASPPAASTPAPPSAPSKRRRATPKSSSAVLNRR
mmetsp:Transcript_59625/g.141880  ORF Transcript_59625/g.141880 Transcript_59625/m.141880 type:complete len:280 (+) Transcript_59625:234-1073(+)